MVDEPLDLLLFGPLFLAKICASRSSRPRDEAEVAPGDGLRDRSAFPGAEHFDFL